MRVVMYTTARLRMIPVKTRLFAGEARRGEFAKLGSDFGEAVGQAIEYGQSITTGVGQRAPKQSESRRDSPARDGCSERNCTLPMGWQVLAHRHCKSAWSS